MSTTLYLDPDTWDLALDASRNIAIARPPYADAQSVANACRLWRGEAPYDADRGVPYESDVLGQLPPRQQIAGFFEKEALSVVSVESATAVLDFDSVSRALTGQIQCTLVSGEVVVINV